MIKNNSPFFHIPCRDELCDDLILMDKTVIFDLLKIMYTV
jgi:hypothetical protein